MSLTINTDKDTILGFGKDVLTNLGHELWKFVKSREGIALISGLLGGTGIGVTASTEKGRQAVTKAWTTIRAELAKIPQSKLNTWVKKTAKACAAKLATGATAAGGAVVAGYVLGLTAGDYFKGDAKNFFKQFGQDLALNIGLGPVASAVKHVVVNKDMVAEDIQNRVIKPIASTLEKIGQKIGIVAKPKDTEPETKDANDNIKSMKQQVMDKLNVSDTGEPNKKSVYAGFNYDEEAKKLGLSTRPSNSAAENEWKKEVEKQMAKKNYKKQTGGNTPDWYVRGNANKLNAGTLTWTTVKDNDRYGKYRFAFSSIFNMLLNIPTQEGNGIGVIHPRIKEQIQIIVQGLRGKNTGAYQYNEQDVYNYIIEMASLIARFKELKRDMSMLNYSTPFVRNAGKELFNEVHFNNNESDLVIPDRPSYISRLNAVANTLNTFAVPNISLISKWNYNSEKVFVDYNGKKPIYGIFNIKNAPKVNTDGSMGVYTKALSFSTRVQMLESEVASLIDIQSTLPTATPGVFLKISADFIKLLGAGKAVFDNVPYASISDVLEVKYDKAANDQLKNAMIFGKDAAVASYAPYDGLTGLNITNATKVSATSFTLSGGYPGSYDDNGKWSDWLMSYDNEGKEKSSAENIEMTQYCFTSAVYIFGTDISRRPLDTPAAIIGNITSFYYVPQATTWLGYENHGLENVSETGTDISLSVEQLQCDKQNDFLPGKILFSRSGTDLVNEGQDLDVDNFAYLSNRQFNTMNNIATYSLFYLYTPEELSIKGILDVY